MGTGRACTLVTVLSARASLPAYPYVRGFDRSHSVVAGSALVLDCRAWGWRTPNVSWYRDGDRPLTPDTDSRVSLTASAPGRPPGSRLTIDGVEETDRAYYTCVAWSDDWPSQHNATVLVRVKGQLPAPLSLSLFLSPWPPTNRGPPTKLFIFYFSLMIDAYVGWS